MVALGEREAKRLVEEVQAEEAHPREHDELAEARLVDDRDDNAGHDLEEARSDETAEVAEVAGPELRSERNAGVEVALGVGRLVHVVRHDVARDRADRQLHQRGEENDAPDLRVVLPAGRSRRQRHRQQQQDRPDEQAAPDVVGGRLHRDRQPDEQRGHADDEQQRHRRDVALRMPPAFRPFGVEPRAAGCDGATVGRHRAHRRSLNSCQNSESDSSVISCSPEPFVALAGERARRWQVCASSAVEYLGLRSSRRGRALWSRCRRRCPVGSRASLRPVARREPSRRRASSGSGVGCGVSFFPPRRSRCDNVGGLDAP